tara:strand:- start:372 stop:800 length:429 start_codon:yes stop_codon:yes gene_type:complete
MNRKGQSLGGILTSNVIYLVFAVLFFFILLWFVLSQQGGAAVWEDFYAKEISKMINLAEPGDEITLDVHGATEIAQDNEVRSFSEMFVIDNSENEICVKLSKGRRSCYNYVNDVEVDLELQLARGDRGDTNVLVLKIKERIV